MAWAYPSARILARRRLTPSACRFGPTSEHGIGLSTQRTEAVGNSPTHTYDLLPMALKQGEGYALAKTFEIHMLTVAQKANILRKAGIPVPHEPQEDPSASTKGEAAEAWANMVNMVFVTYAAARTAKSLRDAEEARQLQVLQQLSAGFSRTWRQTHRA
ncbi:hypothetical protein WKW80_01280 [Variovorax humicola]|uniref:Uncharacterized protein n=1 Tax=Variovorax humicola TaxID=1769758 RepID=A0ABU8VSJ2_9BURK